MNTLKIKFVLLFIFCTFNFLIKAQDGFLCCGDLNNKNTCNMISPSYIRNFSFNSKICLSVPLCLCDLSGFLNNVTVYKNGSNYIAKNCKTEATLYGSNLQYDDYNGFYYVNFGSCSGGSGAFSYNYYYNIYFYKSPLNGGFINLFDRKVTFLLMLLIIIVY